MADETRGCKAAVWLYLRPPQVLKLARTQLKGNVQDSRLRSTRPLQTGNVTCRSVGEIGRWKDREIGDS